MKKTAGFAVSDTQKSFLQSTNYHIISCLLNPYNNQTVKTENCRFMWKRLLVENCDIRPPAKKNELLTDSGYMFLYFQSLKNKAKCDIYCEYGGIITCNCFHFLMLSYAVFRLILNKKKNSHMYRHERFIFSLCEQKKLHNSFF